METLLIRSLNKIATRCISSQTTTSAYYDIGSIRVRVGDHSSTHTDYDLCVYPFGRRAGYATVPNIGCYREVKYFTAVSEVIDYINQFEHFAKVFIKPLPEQLIKNSLQEMPEVKALVDSISEPAPSISKFEDLPGKIQAELSGISGQKSPDLKPILTQIFTRVPAELVDVTIEKVKLCNSLTGSKRYAYLQQFLKTL